MRKPFMAGNWKLCKNAEETRAFFEEFKPLVADVEDVDIALAPTYTSLHAAADALRGTTIALAAQNIFWEAEGAYTGEIAPGMLCEVGCRYVIIGHSERRQYFSETDETVNRRLKAALGAGLDPIFCVGERIEQRRAGETMAVVEEQIRLGLEGIGAEVPPRIVIAYEPVWAIGTGETATPAQAQEVHRFIRERIASLWGDDAAGATRIQYGGSVKPENVDELMAEPDVDGALVGGASLKAASFARIVKFKK